jgi:SAM-dependent methyltransferase
VRAAGAGRARLASVGCGPAAEIGHLLRTHPEVGPHLEVALIDQEERSIAYCERTLSPLARDTGARIHFIRDSIRRLLGARKLSETLGERDLVYSAGLFDYLNDRTFTALAGSLYDALVPGGLLAIGNVAAENPSRWMMEYISEWFLIHRSRADLAAFGQALTPAPRAVQVDSEPLGVNLFLLVRR